MNSTTIKVIGIGGAGGNAIDRMVQCKIKGVDLIAVNTDTQDLRKIQAHHKVRIGRESTKGLGAGMNPELGKKAALESKEELIEFLKGADMVFLTAGLGGGTGGGAIPVIAEIAKSLGVLTIAVVTKPFAFDELLARVRALVRRKYDATSPRVQVADLEIDTTRKTVRRAGREIDLTRREYSLLLYLALRTGEVVSRTEIWENLYEFNSDAHSNVVDVYIGHLRKKLERPQWPCLIHTRRGYGYMLGEPT